MARPAPTPAAFAPAPRRSGVLLHPTSLPGPFGAGDLGPAAHRFVEYLAAAGQSLWQMLPVGPTGAGASPYQSPSAFAGHAGLVSPEALVADGLLRDDDLERVADARRADFAAAGRIRTTALRLAFERALGKPAWRRDLDEFRHRERAWLADHAAFTALKSAHAGRPWTEWEADLRDRHAAPLARATATLATDIDLECFVQLVFARQWQALRRAALARGVALWGDVPIYVSGDGADTWAHRDVFRLRTDGTPDAVAGVPPDAFAAGGQLWGHPLYRWNERATTWRWWRERLRHQLTRFDRLRLDHFIGFARYWEIPADAKTATAGRWRRGPGEALFRDWRRALGHLPTLLFVEDLGVVVPAVERLRDGLDLAGLRVLAFGLGGDPGASPHLPHNYPPDAVAVTGTHDNDTVRGWFDRARHENRHDEVAFALRYLGGDGAQVAWDAIRAVSMSAARDVVFPIQDVLGFGSDTRMNVPGTPDGNWTFRLLPHELDPATAERLGLLTAAMGRRP